MITVAGKKPIMEVAMQTNEVSAEARPPRGSKLSERIDSLREVAATLLKTVESLEAGARASDRRAINLPEEVRRFEVGLIVGALRRTGGHQVRAARLLGIKVTTLNSKIKRYGISIDELGGEVAAGRDRDATRRATFNHAA